MFFDKIEVITPALESENQHLIAPFHHHLTSLSCEQVNIFGYKLFSHCGSNGFPTTLQLFHELPYELSRVGFSIIVCGLPFKHVANAHRNRHIVVSIWERYCDLVVLHLVLVRFKVKEYCMLVGSRLIVGSLSCVFWSSHSHFSMTR